VRVPGWEWFGNDDKIIEIPYESSERLLKLGKIKIF
jgi:hypothetical protein